MPAGRCEMGDAGPALHSVARDAEDEDTRVIETGVQTETDAKAITQADFCSAHTTYQSADRR